MHAAQRGAALLLSTMLIVSVASVASCVASLQSAQQVRDSGFQRDDMEALYLAETGLERAIKLYASGTNCGALNETGVTIVAGSDRQFDISAGVATDFAGAALPSVTQCRVQVTGRVVNDAANPHRNVEHTLQAIVDRNLLLGRTTTYANADFNNPEGGNVVVWSTTANFEATGGREVNASGTACNRASMRQRAAGTLNLSGIASTNTAVMFTLPGGATSVTVNYYYRYVSSTGGGNATIRFALRDTVDGFTDTTLSTFGPTNVTAQAIPKAYAPPNCATDYATGSVVYQTSKSAGPRLIDQIRFTLGTNNPTAPAKQIWLDNVTVEHIDGIGVRGVVQWRDCRNTLCLPAP